MIKRYLHPRLDYIFSDKHTLELWQATELAVIQAMSDLGMIPPRIYRTISRILLNIPINISWWKRRDKKIGHDLNAFLDERVRRLESRLHVYFHSGGMTSYDTEEPATARKLLEALEIIDRLCEGPEKALTDLALNYRYTPFLARTHGQGAELKSFGGRGLTYLVEYHQARQDLKHTKRNLKYSKMSGAIGIYGSTHPKVERAALKILGFVPFYGATQIMPRILYAPLAQALSNLVAVIDKIANDIRLSARSGLPLMQEPFSKMQKGSSAMPHKKNTIRTEQIEGLARAASGYADMITKGIKTWEERSIEQSAPERIAWPDLFHVTAQALKVITGVLTGLKVYPDNMLYEIHQSCGTYASAEAKAFLKDKLSGQGLAHEDIYRMVQLACFNIFEPDQETLAIRAKIPQSLEEARENLWLTRRESRGNFVSLEDFLPQANLKPSDQLGIKPRRIAAYNAALKELFAREEVQKEWHRLFSPAFLMKHEKLLYKKILHV